MADIPFHTHSFDIPTANSSEVALGSRDDVAITPRGLSSSNYYARRQDLELKLSSVVEGTGIEIDFTDPLNPVISVSGEGTGDVVGPVGAVNGRVAVFSGTTGKVLADGGKLVSDFLQTAGAQTITSLKTITIGSAVTAADYLEARPNDYGVGKPAIKITKAIVGNVWSIGLFDTVNNAGTINIDAATFTWRGNALLDVATAQTLSALKTVARGPAITNQVYADWRPTDYGAGKPALQLVKDSTANSWTFQLSDGVDNAGTIRFMAANMLWNGNTFATLGATQLWSRPQYSGIYALTSGTTITIDGELLTGNIMSLTLGSNATLANPVNLPAGMTFTIFGRQDATGGRTLAYGSNWSPIGSASAPAIPAGANAKFRITGQVRGDGSIDFSVSGVGV